MYPPPESDQVHCCFLVDLDVPRLPQDLLDDPPLTLEFDRLASPRWTVEGALSRQGGSRQVPAQGDRGTYTTYQILNSLLHTHTHTHTHNNAPAKKKKKKKKDTRTRKAYRLLPSHKQASQPLTCRYTGSSRPVLWTEHPKIAQTQVCSSPRKSLVKCVFIW